MATCDSLLLEFNSAFLYLPKFYRMEYINAIELKALRESDPGVILLDIREPYELEICSIGGLHIPMADISSRIDELSADEQIIVLCRSGRRAEAVANILVREYMLPKVAILRGGILAWIEDVDNSLESY